MKTNSVKAFCETLLHKVKRMDSDALTKIARDSFSGIEEKIGKDGSKEILDALDALSAQGKAQILPSGEKAAKTFFEKLSK